ncbi:hypothetical protein [Prosthecobacter sp.]|uniref:hypothetical protein n=1 Tax=Prosthecobacter sp. TaxID=1965333 RepID=UPI003784633A
MSDKTLASLTAATPATGGLIYGTQSGADRKFTLSGQGAALVEAATAAEQRTALGLGAISTEAGKSAFIAGGANANVLASTGYEVTGAEDASMVSLAGTLNTTSAVNVFDLQLIHSNLGSGSSLFRVRSGSSGTTDIFNISYIAGAYGIITYAGMDIANHSINLGYFQSGINLAQSWYLGWSSTGPSYDAPDLFLCRSSSATLQLGKNHATAATNQCIQAHDVTTGTGASLTIAGGKGSVAGGEVILGTSATDGAAVARLTVKASGVINVAGIPTSATGLSAGDLYSNGGVLTVV